MKFRIASDIHNEFCISEPPYKDFMLEPMPDDSESTLILAGDIGLLCNKKTYDSFIRTCCSRFEYVFWIAGNHEFYHGNISEDSIKRYKEESGLENLYTEELVLEEEKIVLLGSTLWTEFDNSPVVMVYAELHMNDYRCIRSGKKYEKFRSSDAVILHKMHKKYLFSETERYKSLGYKVIVVSHHHPTFRGVPERFKNDYLNPAYCSDLSKEIIKTKPDYWVCGHIHHPIEYVVGDTTVINNPSGYPGELNTFNQNKAIEL